MNEQTVGALVREWLKANPEVDFTASALAWELGSRMTPGKTKPVQRIRDTLWAASKKGLVHQTGDLRSSRVGSNESVYRAGPKPPPAAPATQPPEAEPPTPEPAAPDAITDWQMGRAVYNYVVHLKNEITTRDNTIRTLRETAKQRDGFRGAELHTKQKRIEELEQSVRVLEQKLAQAVTVRRAQPTPRSLSLAEITKDQRIGG